MSPDRIPAELEEAIEVLGHEWQTTPLSEKIIRKKVWNSELGRPVQTMLTADGDTVMLLPSGDMKILTPEELKQAEEAMWEYERTIGPVTYQG